MADQDEVRHLLNGVASDIRIIKASLKDSKHRIPAVEMAVLRAEERLQAAQGEEKGKTRYSQVRSKKLVKERICRERDAKLLLHPHEDLAAARQLLHDRYRVPLPEKDPKALLNRAKKSLKRFHRVRPDVQRQKEGLIDLVNRGVIPKHADLTGALSGERSVISTSGIEPKHARPHQRSIPASSWDFADGNCSNVELDPFAPDRVRNKAKEDKNERENCDAEATSNTQNNSKSVSNEPVSQEARNYEQMMDEHSLHQLLVVRGKLLDSTPEFQSFQRSFWSIWPRVEAILGPIVNWLRSAHVPVAHLSGKRIALLAKESIGGVPVTKRRMLACMDNEEEVRSQLRRPIKYRGQEGEGRAACAIQRVWRGVAVRNATYQTLQDAKAARAVQRVWRSLQNVRNTRMMVADVMKAQEMEWRREMEVFKQEWPKIKLKERMIIHIPSLSLLRSQSSLALGEAFAALQNSQLSRVCDGIDPNVTVTYVAPFHVGKDALAYYARMATSRSGVDITSRVRMMYPDAARALPSHWSLASSLSCSLCTLRTLRSLSKSRPAYIVPGTVGPEDLRLFASLGLPVLGPDPSAASLYSTKSGGHRIFQAASVNTVLSVTDIYSLNDLLLSLARLLADNPDLPRWLVKIDDDCFSQGTAVVDTSRIKCLSLEARRSLEMKLAQSGSAAPTFRIALRDKVYFELRSSLRHTMDIPPFYSSWQAYIRSMERGGAVVQGEPANIVSRPSVHLLIEPDGSTSIHGLVDNMVGGPLKTTHMASIYPHDPQVPSEALEDAAAAIAAVLYQKNIMGYASVDFIAYQEEEILRLCAVDLDVGLSQMSIGHRIAQTVLPPDTQRSYIQPVAMRHPHLTYLKQACFFQKCRAASLTFDLHTKTGVIFHIVDSVMRGVLGVTCISNSKAAAITDLRSVLLFVQKQLETQNLHTDLSCGYYENNLNELLALLNIASMKSQHH